MQWIDFSNIVGYTILFNTTLLEKHLFDVEIPSASRAKELSNIFFLNHESFKW